MIVVRVRAGKEQLGRSSGGVRLLLDALGCVCAGAPINPRRAPGASLSQNHRCPRSIHRSEASHWLQCTSTVALLRPCSNRHRFAPLTSKMVRSPAALLALAALSTAFVLPPRQHNLAVRIHADEIEAAEDATDAEPRTAPEVNSGAERCINHIVATRPRHRRDACSIA